MIKAAFFDVDGTLLSHKTKEVPASAHRALKELRENGILCIVATGRHLVEIQRLPVKDVTFDGYVTLNGQLCLDGDRKIVWEKPMEGKQKEEIIRMFESREVPVVLVEETGLYINLVNERVHVTQEAISSPIPTVKAYTGNPVYMAIAYLSEEEEKELRETLPDCVITRWNDYGVDIIAGGGGKLIGIQQYLQANGIKQEETIAFGDGPNDEEMLKFAGIGVAMGNAVQSAKEIADYVTADVEDDGILLALKHFQLIK